jgi:hypothetical protein
MVPYILVIIYVRLLFALDIQGLICILYYTIFIAVHDGGNNFTHPQEPKLQSTVLGVCNLSNVKVINSIKRCEFVFLMNL